MARRARGKAAKRRRRSERIWTSASADASESVLPVAGSARFRRRVRVQGNGPRASRLRASGVRAVQEQCTGDATGRGEFGRSSYAGVPAVFQWHTCVSRGSSAREQKNPEVHRGVGIANQSGFIVSSPGSATSSSSYPSPIVRARPRHLEEAREPSYRASSDPFARTSLPWQSRLSSPRITVRNTSPAILRPLQFPSKLLHHPQNFVTVELFSSPILFATGIHFLFVLLHNQGYPKVCPDLQNLPNSGDPFCRNIIVIFLFFVFPDQGLNCLI
jgi:hypothetical protein